MQVILASASPARLAVLRAAGVEPKVVVSNVDEAKVVDALEDRVSRERQPRPGVPQALYFTEPPPRVPVDPDRVVVELAGAKAADVATRIRAEHPDALVIGCDSMLYANFELVGKPGTAKEATKRWREMSGRTGFLVTGHSVLRIAGDRLHTAEGVSSTAIRFGTPDQEEIKAYVRTREPQRVAGGFTIDGLGGWFVESIDGAPSNVIGISLPLLRRLLSQVGVTIADLWEAAGTQEHFRR